MIRLATGVTTPPAVARLAVLMLALAAVGCAGRSAKPGSSLAEAETAVARAERARIGDYDPASWKAARDNLAQARAAATATDKNAEPAARWLAARAKADAELGLVRAERARLSALTQSLKREIAALAPAPSPAPAVTPVPEATP